MEVQTSSHEMPHERPTYQTATWGWDESQNHFKQRVCSTEGALHPPAFSSTLGRGPIALMALF